MLPSSRFNTCVSGSRNPKGWMYDEVITGSRVCANQTSSCAASNYTVYVIILVKVTIY